MASEPTAPQPETSRIGRFIQTYSGFLSSFVIGFAGLVATTVWQYRQADIAERQAMAQQKIAQTQAENSWKIEKADILSKNLQVLSAQGAGNADQRYGVLLSLTRGNILDPELAVSYALELGKDNPEYMRSILESTTGKDYLRLARAFEPTCEQRYGLTRPLPICKGDALAARSEAVAEMISDDLQAGLTAGMAGPLLMLKDETSVQRHAPRLYALFSPAISNLYVRKQWSDLDHVETSSPGARLIASLVIAAARTGEQVTGEEGAKLEKLHKDHLVWLAHYLLGSTCDAECRGNLIEVMLSHYAEAQGDYDEAVRSLLLLPSVQSGGAIPHLHSRLLWCQVDGEDLEPLRDHAVVPAAREAFKNGAKPPPQAADLVGILALLSPPTDPPALQEWQGLMAALQQQDKGRFYKLLEDRRAVAARERAEPPPLMKAVSFCGVPDAAAKAAPPAR